MLEDEGLAGVLILGQEVLGQLVELPLLVLLLGLRDTFSPVGLIPAEGGSHEDIRCKGLAEQVLEVRGLGSLDERFDFRPLGVVWVRFRDASAHSGPEPDLDHPRAQGQNLIGAFVEEVLVRQMVFPRHVGHTHDVAQILPDLTIRGAGKSEAHGHH
jgi:hypothetical protein